MVSASFFVAALFASIAFVSASPAPHFANINSGHHLGAEDVILRNIANNALQVNDLSATSKIFFY
jgi:hypothetical protein